MSTTTKKSNANRAVRKIRALFDDAEKAGHLLETWKMLSALRGPDKDPDCKLKHTFTTPIRKIFLKRSQADTLSVSDWDEFPDKRLDKVDMLEPVTTNHFEYHAFMAREAINSTLSGLLKNN